MFYSKGQWGYDFNNGVRKQGKNVTHKFTVKNKKMKNGTVTYFTVADGATCEPLAETDVIKNISKVAEISKTYNTWVDEFNSQVSSTKTSSSSEPVDSDDDEEIDFN